MSEYGESRLVSILETQEDAIVADWINDLIGSGAIRGDLINRTEVRDQAVELIRGIAAALRVRNGADLSRAEWRPVKEHLSAISRTRAVQGFTPAEVATFVFSLKRPLFRIIQEQYSSDAAALASELWTLTEFIDQLGLFTTEVYQKSREEVIIRQNEDLLELSTPVVQLFDGILALPIIGTLDSARTQIVMENLLKAIVETGSDVAIIDITGVATVDTLVSQHLLKTVAAARLMGAECIISGIRPQIAQTIVHLGVDLSDVATKATLADAFMVALKKVGASISRGQAR